MIDEVNEERKVDYFSSDSSDGKLLFFIYFFIWAVKYNANLLLGIYPVAPKYPLNQFPMFYGVNNNKYKFWWKTNTNIFLLCTLLMLASYIHVVRIFYSWRNNPVCKLRGKVVSETKMPRGTWLPCDSMLLLRGLNAATFQE